MHFAHASIPLESCYHFYACLLLVGIFGGFVSFCLELMIIYGTGGVELVSGLSLVGLLGLIQTLMPPWSTAADEDFYFSFDNSNSNEYNTKLLDELAIDTMVLRKKNKSDAKLISSPCGGGYSCSICLHGLEAGDEVSIVTACHHAFHSKCLKMWIPKSATCPYCRQDLEIVRENDEEETSDNIHSGEGRMHFGAWEMFEGVFD